MPDRAALSIEPGLSRPTTVSMIVAHRGASAVEAENTLAAFEVAVAVGADAVEFDVRMTADGHAVVIHDPDVGRTTNGRGLVRDLSLTAVKRLRIRTMDGGAAEVPTLQEALDLLSGRASADIEIKNVPGEPDFEAGREAAVEATLQALEATGFRGLAMITSFNPFSIAHAKALDPEVTTGLLTQPQVQARAALAFASEQGHRWVLPALASVREAGEGLVVEAHGAGMLLGTWITDDPEQAVELMRWGVDAVATNDPAAIVAARAAAFAT